jgi:Phosphopantetheine attachment site
MTKAENLDAAQSIRPRDDTSFDNPEPMSSSERYLARTLSAILGVTCVGPSSKFPEIGGNSLNLVLVLSQIHRDYRISMDGKWFFRRESSSVRELARKLDELLGVGNSK